MHVPPPPLHTFAILLGNKILMIFDYHVVHIEFPKGTRGYDGKLGHE